jgi:hypothetical protein
MELWTSGNAPLLKACRWSCVGRDYSLRRICLNVVRIVFLSMMVLLFMRTIVNNRRCSASIILCRLTENSHHSEPLPMKSMTYNAGNSPKCSSRSPRIVVSKSLSWLRPVHHPTPTARYVLPGNPVLLCELDLKTSFHLLTGGNEDSSDNICALTLDFLRLDDPCLRGFVEVSYWDCDGSQNLSEELTFAPSPYGLALSRRRSRRSAL